MRVILPVLFLFALTCFGQYRIGTGAVEKLYQQNCMSCHGEDLSGGLGNSLLDQSTWKLIGSDLSFIEYVKQGNIAMGMPGFEQALSEIEIRSLQVYVDEMRQKAAREEGAPLVRENNGVYTAGGHEFRLETVVTDLKLPWSIAFISEGEAFITERAGSVRLWSGSVLGEPIEGTPQVAAHGQGGMLEVALHPEYAKNGWVYLAYSATAGPDIEKKPCMTKVVRGRVVANQWQNEEVIFEVPANFHRDAGVHFGTRLVFQDGYLFFGIGDRGASDQAQDLTRPNGKIHRIHDDGRIPKDNPYLKTSGAYPTIWTYGNRNPQGLDAHPVTGAIFESEHGPRGGDEINLIERGVNYGWPVITYGINYNGKPMGQGTAASGMMQPLHYWTPSIAVCGIDFYEGDAFPKWKHNLFAGGLASQELHRLVVEDNAVVQDEIILKNQGRVRDVASGPDGYLYVVLNAPDVVARLVPVTE